jgi:hypothetical protein
MFETHGDKAVEVGAGESDPAVGGAFDFDVAENGQRWAWADDLAKPCDGGFEFIDRKCDGFHMGCVGCTQTAHVLVKAHGL